MLTEIIMRLDAIGKVQDTYMCRQFYCPCDASNQPIVDNYSYNYLESELDEGSFEKVL